MFKPMLASPADLASLKFPLFASPKLDGIRAAVVEGKLLSRTLKPIPNQAIFAALSRLTLDGLDGELIVGEPTDKDVYRNTVSGVMGVEATSNWRYFVFDDYSSPDEFQIRLQIAHRRIPGLDRVVAHEHVEVSDHDELLAYEAKMVAAGYEGLILRSINGPYKFGRSTAREGWMLKLKRFEDSEAEVIGVEEEMFNGNEAQTNELGRTKRSTAKAGLVGKGTMGALIVRDLKTKVEFNIGTGFTAADRSFWWKWFETQNEETPKPLVKYKHFPVGVKDKPRHPVFLGIRSKIDL